LDGTWLPPQPCDEQEIGRLWTIPQNFDVMYLYRAGNLEHSLVKEPIQIGVLAGKAADIDQDAYVPAQLFKLTSLVNLVRTRSIPDNE